MSTRHTCTVCFAEAISPLKVCPLLYKLTFHRSEAIAFWGCFSESSSDWMLQPSQEFVTWYLRLFVHFSLPSTGLSSQISGHWRTESLFLSLGSSIHRALGLPFCEAVWSSGQVAPTWGYELPTGWLPRDTVVSHANCLQD